MTASFDPFLDLPPGGASATVTDPFSPLRGTTFVFDRERGLWDAGWIVARPFSSEGIRLARLWAAEVNR